ncbi:DEAD/DEAH box helicase family protein [Enterococcus faecium]|uniref:DEAD/DEAH box helicase family protein n=1 Tax=Enterococcus faecium TaxID=1352 RepID=UPI0035CA4796
MDKTVIKPFEEIKYKVYGYTLPEVPNHNGYVKIGDTTREVVTRIFEQVGTAGLNPKILFEKVARKSDGEWFRDKDLHRFLILNGIEKKDFNSRADEWFYFNGTLEKAEELTNKFINRDYDEIQIDDKRSDYVLRNEQQQAVEKTYEYYQSNQEPKEFLWNAKPRFGKTLTTYDFIRNLNARNVLIVTNRPAIANSWFDDFNKFIGLHENVEFLEKKIEQYHHDLMSSKEEYEKPFTYEKELQEKLARQFELNAQLDLENAKVADADLGGLDESKDSHDSNVAEREEDYRTNQDGKSR